MTTRYIRYGLDAHSHTMRLSALSEMGFSFLKAVAWMVIRMGQDAHPPFAMAAAVQSWDVSWYIYKG